MGSTGNLKGSSNNEPTAIRESFPTRYNEYGFEIEDSNSPAIEFSELTWKNMAELRKLGGFEDSDLANDVDNRIYDLVTQYGDLERYDSDLTTLRDKLDGENITSDEYWAGYHTMANILGINPRRYTVLDASGNAWDDRFTSVEQAESWANERSDAAYVYDKWTRKQRKIGGKNWR